MAVRTYIDTGVLIQAISGKKELSEIAMAFLYDPLREYITSDYVKIELLPKCTFHKNNEERQFYEEFFQNCATRVPSSDDLLALAIEEVAYTIVRVPRASCRQRPVSECEADTRR